MRREPITDAVLRAALLPNGDDGPWMIGPPTRLISELLALRGAARRMLTKARSVYDRLCRESGQSPAQDSECWAEAEALDDLLPKEPDHA